MKQSPLQKAIGKKSISSEMKGGRSKKIPMRVLMRQEAAAGVKDVSVQNSAVNIILKGIFAFVTFVYNLKYIQCTV